MESTYVYAVTVVPGALLTLVMVVVLEGAWEIDVDVMVDAGLSRGISGKNRY